MGITVTEPAATTMLTTLARAQSELGLESGTNPDMLTDMIERASSAIARETRRVFGVETVIETLDGSGSRLLGLNRWPIVEITEVTEDGNTVDSSEYSIEDADSGAVYRANGWGRSSGLRMYGTEAFASGYILPGYRDLRYSVTYRAGYLLPAEVNPFIVEPQALPGAVEQACLETVKAWYLAAQASASSASSGGTGPVSSVSVGALRVAYGDTSSTSSSTSNSTSASTGSLPASALGLLRNYYQVQFR